MPPLITLLDISRQAITHGLERLVMNRRENGPSNQSRGLLTAVDGTCGNGHDTLFLAENLSALAGQAGLEWRVVAFDVQEEAINRTRQRLQDAGLEGAVDFHLESHAHLGGRMAGQPLAAAMFNLGYLPGSDKSVVTSPTGTIAALEACLERSLPGGIVSVHAYGGHPGGSEEMARLAEWFGNLDGGKVRVTRHEVWNKRRNPETLYLAEKII